MACVIAHLREGVCAMKMSYFLRDLVKNSLQEVPPKFGDLGFPQCLGQLAECLGHFQKKNAGGLFLCHVVKRKRGCLCGR